MGRASPATPSPTSTNLPSRTRTLAFWDSDPNTASPHASVISSRVGKGAPVSVPRRGLGPGGGGGGGGPAGGRGTGGDGAGRRPAAGRRLRGRGGHRRRVRRGTVSRVLGSGGAGRSARLPLGCRWPRSRAGRRRRLTAGTAPAASARSRRSMRWRRAAGETSDSGRHRRTSDTSSSTRGSGASRMATSASPSSSMALTAAARPSRAIWASTRARSSSGRPTRLRDTVARKAWRRRSSSSTASCRGSWPAPTRSATAASARPTSCSQRASISSSVEGPTSSMPPAAATWSSLDRASRADPAPRLATSSMTSSGMSSPASWATHRRWSARTSVDSRRNSKCWVRLRMVGSTFWGSVVARTKITCPGRLLQGLEQGVRGLGGQHVDLVDDVHLPPPGRAQVRPGDQVAHGVDPPVGGGVELDDVEGPALGDLGARRADAAGLAVEGVHAVQGLGQDAGAGRLARAPGAAEQVGVGDPVVPDGVAERVADVVLAPDVGEALGPEPPVERLEGHRSDVTPWVRLSAQAWRQCAARRENVHRSTQRPGWTAAHGSTR